MSLSQGFPSTFSNTQTTIDVLHNLDNETKKIYTDVNNLMETTGHAHSGSGTDGAAIPAANIVVTPAGSIAATDVQAALNELDPAQNRVDYKKSANIASATSLDLTTATGNIVHITGSTTIASVVIGAGQILNVIFDAAPLLTHGATLVCPTAANIQAAAGDRCIIVGDAANVANVVSYQKADGTALVAAISGGASIGLGDYIADGFAVTPGTGLQAVIGTGRVVVSETLVEQTATANVALLKRRAQLVYKTKANADGIIGCKYPAYNDAAMVIRYDMNHFNGQWLPEEYWPVNATVEASGSYYIVTTAGTSAATEPTWPGSGTVTDGTVVWTKQAGAGTYVPNSASAGVANNLTPSGTVSRVDGRKGFAYKGNGSTGYFAAANQTGIPTGTTAQEWTVKITYKKTGAAQCWMSNSPNQSYAGFLGATSTDILDVAGGSLGAGVVNYVLEDGKTYEITWQYNGTTHLVYVNGVLVFTQANTAAFGGNVINIGRWSGQSSQYSQTTVHYFEIRNALRTPAQIATVAQEMLIPCAYGATDIRTVLPADSMAAGYVETDGTVPTLIVDGSNPGGATPDWAYGIRVGPMGILNKTKRLGRKVFSGTSAPEWDNPFGSRNMTLDGEWSLDATGTNSSPIPNDAANSYPSILVNGKIRETITTGVMVAGVQKTSGYIDIIAEVIG